MTATWLATESNPVLSEANKPGGGGNLPCTVFIIKHPVFYHTGVFAHMFWNYGEWLYLWAKIEI
jgi:hypothetical protein